jgi:hypothetical protein
MNPLCLSAAALALSAAVQAPVVPPLPSPSTPPPAPTASPERTFAMERLQWAKEVDGAEPITAIEVRNDFGDIRARGAGDRRLEATMVVQRLDRAGDKVGFTVERRGSVVALDVAYPPGRVRDTEAHPAKDSYDRLDLVIFVPHGVALRAQTLRGRVEVRGLASDVEAATLDGPIFVRTEGGVQARTDSGTVTAMLDAEVLAAAGAPMLLQSGSGPITLWLPPRGTPDLRVETAGQVSSRLALRRSKLHGRTRAALGLATAARQVVVSSRTGAVTVEREEPSQFKAAPGAEKE